MEFRIDRENRLIHFTFPSLNRCGTTTVVLRYPKEACISTLEKLCAGIIDSTIGVASESIPSALYFFKRMLKFAERMSLPVEESHEWSQFVLNLFVSFISGELHGHSCKLKTRQQEWANSGRYFEQWKAENIIPSHVYIPPARIRTPVSETHGSSEHVIGETIRKINHSEIGISNKYLLDISYSKNIEVQLDEIQRKLSDLSNNILRIATEHWEKMQRCLEIGKRLMLEASQNDIYNALNNENFSKEILKFSDTKRIGILLSAAHYKIFKENTPPSIAALMEHQFFEKNFGRADRVLHFETSTKKIATDNLPKKAKLSGILNALIGIPQLRDYAAAAIIITHYNPQFNASSLWNARLFDRHGKSHATPASVDASVFFEVKKPRAKSVKNAILNETCREVMNKIIEITAPMREILKERKSHHADMLFITSDLSEFGFSSGSSHAMNGKLAASLYNLYEDELSNFGVSRNSFTLSKIRATRGILKWFETGSISHFARALGNSEASVLKSYMPSWLLNKYNERIIRRFQQMLIICSTSASPILLHATDFSSIHELVHFVENSLQECHNDDPFSKEFVRRVSSFVQQTASENIKSNLALNLSLETIVLLYEIHAWEENNIHAIEEIDNSLPNGLSVSTLSSLAKLIKICSTSSPSTPQDFAIQSNLNGGSNLTLRMLHEQAVSQMERNEGYLDKLEIFQV